MMSRSKVMVKRPYIGHDKLGDPTFVIVMSTGSEKESVFHVEDKFLHLAVSKAETLEDRLQSMQNTIDKCLNSDE